MKPPRLVAVCDHCQRASCWQGKFMCDASRYAGTYNMPIDELKKLKLENPSYWEDEDYD
jgi:hypothetical protein